MDKEARLHGTTPAEHPEALRLWLRLLTCTQLIETQVRTHLREAFQLHQLNHDEIPDTVEELRTRNARILQSLRDQTQQITFARYEAERRMRSMQRYADFFESIDDGVIVMDEDGTVLGDVDRFHGRFP